MVDKRLAVQAEGKHVYDIVIRESFAGLPDELKAYDIDKKKLCIVTETNVASFYLDQVKSILEPACSRLEVFRFMEGEASKNLDTVSSLYKFLIEQKFDRKDMLIALGGGVVGDLTGFAAATYLRGIDFVQVPTSLLSQVDSSIGGKTGVDYQAYKNMVGAFYMPRLVYINISTLKTLSDRQLVSGLGEVIKHGLIQDADYYRWILSHKEAIAAREPQAMAVMVEGSCRIKRAVVEEDPREQGIRACLNFGHTLGHAIEKLMDFQLTHGECVGIGSVLAADLSKRRGFISEEEYQEMLSLYEYFTFPALPGELKAEDILEATKHDKKMEQGKIKFILLKSIGEAEIFRDVTDEEILGLFN